MLNKLFKILLTIIIIVVFLVFIDNFNKKDINKGSQNLNTNYVNSDLIFYQADYGLYEFDYKNNDDYYFAIGYLHAVDRLWQLDFIRRKYSGELAEILGEKYVLQDKFYRCFNIKHFAEKFFISLPKNEKEIFINYTNGINYYVTQNENQLSFEFNHLNYKPRPWNPQDIIANYLFFIIENDKYKDFALVEKLNNYKSDVESDSTINKMIKRKSLDFVDSFIQKITNNNLFALYENDFINELKLIVDTNKTNQNHSKLITHIDDKKGFLSYFKYDKLDYINDYYPIVSRSETQTNFEYSIVGLPFSILKICNGRSDLEIQNNVDVTKISNTNQAVYLKQIIDNYSKDYYSQNIKKSILNFKIFNQLANRKTIKYDVDTLKIKAKTPIQFYKRNIENSEFIISDYSYKNQELNDSAIVTFKLDSVYLENAIKILQKYLSLQSGNQNSNQVVKQNSSEDLTQNTLLKSETMNKNNNNKKLDIQNFINKELYVNISQLSNITIKDVKLLQNISNNELTNKLLNIIKSEQFNLYKENSNINIHIRNVELKDLYLKVLIYNKNENMFKKDIEIQNLIKKHKTSKIYKYFEKNNINTFKNDFLQLLISELNKELKINNIEGKENTKYSNNSIKFEPQKLYNLYNYFEDINMSIRNNNQFKDSIQQTFRNVFIKTIQKFEKLDIKKLNSKIKVLHPLSFDGILSSSLNFEILQKGNFGSINHLNNIKNEYFDGVLGHSVRLIYDFAKQDVYYTMYGGTSSNFVNENYNNHLILWSNSGYLKYSLKNRKDDNTKQNYILKISNIK